MWHFKDATCVIFLIKKKAICVYFEFKKGKKNGPHGFFLIKNYTCGQNWIKGPKVQKGIDLKGLFVSFFYKRSKSQDYET